MVLLHSLAMNGGVLHAIETRSPDERAAAVRGYRYFVTARDYVTDWHWTKGEGLKNDLAEIHGRVAHLGLIRLSVQRDDRAFRWDHFLRTAAVPTLLRGFREFLHRLEPDRAARFDQPRPDSPRIDLVAEIDRVIGA
jgi:hypothetical protein